MTEKAKYCISGPVYRVKVKTIASNSERFYADKDKEANYWMCTTEGYFHFFGTMEELVAQFGKSAIEEIVWLGIGYHMEPA